MIVFVHDKIQKRVTEHVPSTNSSMRLVAFEKIERNEILSRVLFPFLECCTHDNASVPTSINILMYDC